MKELQTSRPKPADKYVTASHQAPPPAKWAASREPVRESRGERSWRSLEELADTPEFQRVLHREFPRHAAEWDQGVDRRQFLQLSSAALALAGLSACTKQPLEKIVPYVRAPEDLVPGKPLFFATAMPLAGYAAPLLAESHMGRPTKVEGNPEHPASQGATDVLAQASILELYDPDRSQAVTHQGKIRSWSLFLTDLAPTVTALAAAGGRGLRILSGSTSSPTFGALAAELRTTMPEARWHRWEPVGRGHTPAAARATFGEAVEVRYDLRQADVVVAIDADFLTSGPAAIRYAKDFAARRQVHDRDAAMHGMSRLYAIETLPTPTGSVADHRLPLAPVEVAHFVLALAARFGVSGAASSADLGDEAARWVEAIAADLEAHRGAGLVVAGDALDVEVQTLIHGINAVLGNLGTTVVTTEPVEVDPVDPAASLAELVADMQAGAVDTLLILGANPVYSAPADLDFVGALAKVRLRVHLGLHQDETAEHCQWHLPEAHYLESWVDVRSPDGTVSIGQPLIERLYEGKTALEVMAAVLGRGIIPSDELIREHWQRQWQEGRAGSGETFERFWRRSLHDGFVAGTELPSRPVTPNPAAVAAAAATVAGWSADGLELVFRPDPTIFDGRFANNGWLQECPKPVTKLTWDNALLMSPRTAREHGLGDLVKGNDQRQKAPVVRLAVGRHSLEVPVWVVPGMAPGALVLHLGYGRRRCGRVGTGAGVDAGRIRTVETLWRVSSGVAIERTGGTYRLASTQDHHSMEGRDLVRTGSLADYQQYLEHPGDEHLQFPAPAHHGPDSSLSLMPGWKYDSYAWGLTVDLTTCTGCNACVVACQAENNIPVVGREQVAAGREMHWIRIDRYFSGDGPDEVTEVLNQPVCCMHCEQAPCEVVCPVAATVHSDEGLNDMVYNRCVGTRYCSNNCPYKVRRFNFLLYQDFETPSLQLARNPDVTVRSRGVMEKCTYCVQRINQARISARRQGREIADGEIKTACQQVCPSDALVFGDVNDESSAVAQRKRSPLNYRLLDELGTRPRTTYLSRIRNLNPVLTTHHAASHGAAKAHGA